jgi:hypothetical protein
MRLLDLLELNCGGNRVRGTAVKLALMINRRAMVSEIDA